MRSENASAAKVRKNGKSKTLKLGKASFSIPAGKTVTVKVKISKKGAKLIRRKGKLKAKVRASATDGRGGTPKVTTSWTQTEVTWKRRRTSDYWGTVGGDLGSKLDDAVAGSAAGTNSTTTTIAQAIPINASRSSWRNRHHSNGSANKMMAMPTMRVTSSTA